MELSKNVQILNIVAGCEKQIKLLQDSTKECDSFKTIKSGKSLQISRSQNNSLLNQYEFRAIPSRTIPKKIDLHHLRRGVKTRIVAVTI